MLIWKKFYLTFPQTRFDTIDVKYCSQNNMFIFLSKNFKKISKFHFMNLSDFKEEFKIGLPPNPRPENFDADPDFFDLAEVKFLTIEWLNDPYRRDSTPFLSKVETIPLENIKCDEVSSHEDTVTLERQCSKNIYTGIISIFSKISSLFRISVTK